MISFSEKNETINEEMENLDLHAVTRIEKLLE